MNIFVFVDPGRFKVVQMLFNTCMHMQVHFWPRFAAYRQCLDLADQYYNKEAYAPAHR